MCGRRGLRAGLGPCLLVAILVAAAVEVARANVVELAEFRVIQPSKDKMKANIALANFGRPEYGADLQGHIAIPYEDQATSNCDDRICKYGCSSLNGSYSIQNIMGLPAVMMLERGPPDDNCPFYQKALNAQEAGARALMIAGYDNTLFTMDAPRDDESWSTNVTIPVALIGRSDADKLITAYNDNPLLIGAMNWTNAIPKGAKVRWEFWTSSDDACGVKCQKQKQFLETFAPIATRLEQNGWTEFTPHYMMWTCPQQYRQTALCDNLCIEGGEYCAPDPEEDEEKGYDGIDVVLENKRDICIFKQANATGEPWFWWDFVTRFDEECSMEKSTYDDACSERVFLDAGGQKLGGGLNALRSCMRSNESLSYLEDEVKAQVSSDVILFPSIVINGAQYRGALEASSVLKALCSAFHQDFDSQPSMCACTTIPDSRLLSCVAENGNDACKPGQAVDVACSANAKGLTRCVQDIDPPFYDCQCEEGFELIENRDGNKVCRDINECLRYASGIDDCTCSRCACHNLQGTFQCESGIPDPCAYNNGGCWSQVIDGKKYSACHDRILEYKNLAASGADVSLDTFKMSNCTCPEGFIQTSHYGEPVTCKKKCPKGSVYHIETGLCLQDAEHTRKETEEWAKESGISITLITIILVALLALCGVAFGIYRYRLRSYMDKEIRSIMSQYMPLEEDQT